MKRALLFFSLAANVALAWAFLDASPAAEPVSTVIADAARPGSKSSTSLASTPTVRTHATGTPESLRDELRRLGFSEADVRRALRAQIEAPRLQREREFRTAARNSGSFWRDTWGSRGRLPPAQRDELQAMRGGEREEMTRLFGAETLLQPGELDALAFLPSDKARQVALLERGYAEMRRELDARTGVESLTVAEREKRIAAVRDRDLVGVLTPEERALLDIRDSDTAQRLRNRFEFFHGTDAEYRVLFTLQRAFDDQFGANGISVGNSPRTAANQQLAEDIRAALGPSRAEEWLSNQRPELQALAEVQRRENVPAAAVEAVRQIPTRTSEAALRIAADSALSAEQKVAALRDLADRARAEVRAVLGSDLGDAYNTASARGWLDYLDRGSTYAIGANGNLTTRPVGSRSPPPPRN